MRWLCLGTLLLGSEVRTFSPPLLERHPCLMLALPASIISFITTILWPNKSVPPPYPASYLRFHLRHEHALSPSSQTIFRDAPSPNAAFASSDAYDITFHPVSVYRPRALTSGSLLWDPDKVLGPNVSSRVTLQALAKMTNNAYSEPGAKDWYGLGEDWSVVCFLFCLVRGHLTLTV